MILQIDTSEYNKIKLALLFRDKRVEQSVEVQKNQSEKLLPLIHEFLRKNGFDKTDIEEIGVENRGDSFTSLRVGVITANTLAYALKIPVYDFFGGNIDISGIKIVKPYYGREPNIKT